MKTINENLAVCGSLVIYASIGVVLRYFITPTCNSGFDYFHIVFPYVIIFITISIIAGLYSLFCTKNPLNKVARGIVTGFSVGFGGMTVYALISNLCI